MNALILRSLGTLIVTLSLISTIAHGGDFNNNQPENTSDINSILRNTELLRVATKYIKSFRQAYNNNEFATFISVKFVNQEGKKIPETKENTNLLKKQVESMFPKNIIKIFEELYKKEKAAKDLENAHFDLKKPKSKSMSKESVLIKRFNEEIIILESQTTTE